MKTKKPLKTYRVWVDQVNQSMFEVRAKSPEEAREKGSRKWMREYADSEVTCVVELPSAAHTP